MTDHQAQAAGIRCTCRVLPLDYVPRAQVNRDTRGFIKIVADADTNQIVGITAVTTDAGDLAAAGGYILAANMTVTQLATQWSPYLDRKSTRLNSSHVAISYAVFCLKKKNNT